jgi:endonuclease YncB( thermonuclease family)
MFHFLHKVYLLAWVALITGGALLLYPRSGISEPLALTIDVLKNSEGLPGKTLENLSGTPIQIYDGASFMMRGSDSQLYTIGLVGVTAPPPSSPPARRQNDPATRSKAHLSELILSNEVQVALTWMDPHSRGLGIVRIGKTNVNAAMVESGLADLNRAYIKGLSWPSQYVLLRAERRAGAKSAATPQK